MQHDDAMDDSAEPKIKVTLYLTPEFAAALSRACRVSGISRGKLVERMLSRSLEQVTRTQLPSSLRYGPARAGRAAEEFFRDGEASYTTVAEALNKHGYQTTQGKSWNRYSVFRLLNRPADPVPKINGNQTKTRTTPVGRKRGR